MFRVSFTIVSIICVNQYSFSQHLSLSNTQNTLKIITGSLLSWLSSLEPSSKETEGSRIRRFYVDERWVVEKRCLVDTGVSKGGGDNEKVRCVRSWSYLLPSLPFPSNYPSPYLQNIFSPKTFRDFVIWSFGNRHLETHFKQRQYFETPYVHPYDHQRPPTPSFCPTGVILLESLIGFDKRGRELTRNRE